MAATHSVVGPPGTGKTTYLTRQSQLAAVKYRPQDVLIASLTRAAAQEVAGRRTTIPAENISTLHSHCYRALERPLLAQDPDGVKEWNAYVHNSPAFRLSAGVYGNGDEPWSNFACDGDELLAELDKMRARRRPPETYTKRLTAFAQRWDAFKRARARIDFTDMIERALNEIGEPPGRPKVIMVDEAQDLSALEMALIRKWAQSAEQLVIVGDPDQNLYEWRGTDPGAMLDGETTSHRVLEQSFRVPKAVHAYAVNWISKAHGREPVAYKPTEVEGEVRRMPVSWPEPRLLVHRLKQDAEEGKTSMVLASCGYMLNPLCAEMKQEGIAFHNPYRLTHGGWNPLRGTRRMLAFLSPMRDEEHEWTWAEVEQWSEPLAARSVMVHGGRIEIERRANEFPSASVSVDELSEIFKPEFLPAIFACDLTWYTEHVRASRAQQMAYGLRLAEKRGVEALAVPPRTCVGTIHSVKGGEADRIYVFPDLSHVGFWKSWQGGYKPRASVIRQFYVAFTRAREQLTILAPVNDEAAALPRPR